MREELDKITDRWGVKITKVEIQGIDPPRKERAMILIAEGKKESATKHTEGEK